MVTTGWLLGCVTTVYTYYHMFVVLLMRFLKHRFNVCYNTPVAGTVE